MLAIKMVAMNARCDCAIGIKHHKNTKYAVVELMQADWAPALVVMTVSAEKTREMFE